MGAEAAHLGWVGDEIVAQLTVGDLGGGYEPGEQAVAAGASEASPVADEHGWRLGRVVDPFGHEWEIGRPLGPWPAGDQRGPGRG